MTTRYEAETQTLGGGLFVADDQSGFSGTGYADYSFSIGDRLTFTIDVPTSGFYEIDARYAQGSDGARPLTVYVSGDEIATNDFASTGSWDSWTDTTLTRSVFLEAGEQTVGLALESPGGGPNIDYIDVTGPSSATGVIGEYGSIAALDSDVLTVDLESSYSDPVVIAGPLSFDGGDFAVPRLVDVGSDSFSVFAQESSFDDGVHVDERLGYLVVEAGVYQLADGRLVEVGHLESELLSADGFAAVEFEAPFASAPAVLSTVQTFNGADLVTTRQRNASADGVEIAMQEVEAKNTSGHTTERIGYVAIEAGTGAVGGGDLQVGSLGGVTDAPSAVTFDPAIDGTPAFLAALSSFAGPDPATLRGEALDGDGAVVTVQEDTTADDETVHTDETVDFLALDGDGLLTGGPLEGFTPPTPVTYEAEAGTVGGSAFVTDANAGFSGSGYADFGFSPGDSVTLTVEISVAGNYDIETVYANGADVPRPLAIRLDGAPLATPSFASTGGWTSWNALGVADDVFLDVGTHEVEFRLESGLGGPNLDNVTVSWSEGAAPPPPEPEPEPEPEPAPEPEPEPAPGPLPDNPASAGPHFSAIRDDHELVFYESFNGDTLNADSEGRGLWAMEFPWGVDSGAGVVDLHPDMPTPQGDNVGIDPFVVANGTLALNKGFIPSSRQDELYDFLNHFYTDGEVQLNHANGTTNYTHYDSKINTHETWAQSYGYIEARAQMAPYYGTSNAFWLVPWNFDKPPELDIYEVVGKNYTRGEDFHRVAQATHFDNYDRVTGDRYDPSFIDTGETNVAEVNWDLPDLRILLRDLPFKGEQLTHYITQNFVFANSPAVKTALNIPQNETVNIYEDFYVYGLEWNEDEIIYYFGTSSENMIEVFRFPTPPGFDVAMGPVFSNGLFNSWPGGNDPTHPEYELGIESDHVIDYLKMYAPVPATVLRASEARLYGTPASEQLVGDDGANVLYGAGGLDWLTGNAGADLFVLADLRDYRKANNIIIRDFNPDEGDKILLEGLRLDDAFDAYRSAYEVGEDVWISRGANFRQDGNGTLPQTVIIREIARSELSPDDFIVRYGVGRDPSNPSFGQVARWSDGEVTIVGTDADEAFSTYFGGFFDVPRIDALQGYGGDDWYRVLDSTTEIIEAPNAGRDTIEVQTSSYTLPMNVENAEVVPSYPGTSVLVRGNAADNVITANDRGLRTDGGGGDDLVVLGGGKDYVHVDEDGGWDSIDGFASEDVLVLGARFFESRTAARQALEQDGDDVLLLLGANEGVRFRDNTVGQFSEANFGFADTLGDDVATTPAGLPAEDFGTPPGADEGPWGLFLF